MKGENAQRTALIVFITVVAALGGFLFGFDSGVINGAVTAISEEFNSKSVATGFNVSSVLLGCIVGALFSGYFADKFGRKPVMLGMCALFIITAWGAGIAGSSTEFVIYRLIGGFGVGAASAICPAYICEISPTKLRGRLTSMQQMAIVCGLFAAFLSNYAIAKFSGGASEVSLFGFKAWQWMFWTGILPAVLFLIGIFFIPESPRYLVAKGNLEGARAVLARLFGEDVDGEIEKIRESMRGQKASFSDLLKPNSFNLKPIVWVGLIVAIFQQISGINVIFYYGEVLWRSVGVDETRALAQNVISGGVNIFATAIAMLLIDRLGRKCLLISGALLMTISLAAMSIIFSFASVSDKALTLPPHLAAAAFIFAIIYVFSFCASWGPVVWTLLAEMFPNSMRASAVALCAGGVWLSNFVVTMTFPPMLSGMGLPSTYAIYAVFSLLSLVFVSVFVKETKGISLEQMNSR